MQYTTALALFVRISIALLTTTFFQPDEYFQSLEVAHYLVFGYGHLTWEWLAPQPIRSILYPALNIPIYWALKATGLDNSNLLIWLPKILHGIFAALTDIWLCDLTKHVIGARYVSTALFLSLTSFFHGLSLSRSLSNSLETSLTTIALSYFPWHPDSPIQRAHIRKMLLCAACACAVRSTNAIIWIYVLGVLTWRLRAQPSVLRGVIVDILAVGCIALSALFIADSLFYHTATLTPLNFIRTNLSSVSSFYGTTAWHYYFSQAVPIISGTSLPFVLHGCWLLISSGTAASRTVLGIVSWTLSVYSLLGHKEWRFIHPLLPLLHIIAAKSLVDGYHATTPPKVRRDTKRLPEYRLPIRGPYLCFIMLALPVLVYVSRFHSRAQIDVMHFLRSLPPTEIKTAGFLMPCHSTPWQAYLHNPELADPGRFWAIGCEPPLQGQDIGTYKDQTDIFYDDPIAYLRTRFPADLNNEFPPSPYPSSKPGEILSSPEPWKHEWPQYFICFGALLDEPDVQAYLEDKMYVQVWREEYGWEGDRRRQGGVVVWKSTAKSPEATQN